MQTADIFFTRLPAPKTLLPSPVLVRANTFSPSLHNNQ